jgi:hypothetical protein
MKAVMWGAIGVVAVLLWHKGQAAKTQESVVEAGMHQDGSNWMGDMWQRLAGLDLTYKGFSNVDGTANADVTKVTQVQIPVSPWPN